MEEIIMFRSTDGKMFDDEDECRKYEAEFVVRKYENIIKFWDSNKNRIPLIDVLTKGRNYDYHYFQVQLVAKDYYSDLVEALNEYTDLEALYEFEKNVGDIIFYDETLGRHGDWVSLDERAAETTAMLEELRGY